MSAAPGTSLVSPAVATSVEAEPARGGLPRRWAPVAAAVVAAVAAAFAYSLVTPHGFGPDETSHWAYVQSLVHGALPGATVPERQQPPLFYILGAGVAALGGDLWTVRLVSVALAAFTPLLAALTAREVWPAAPRRWALVAAAIALLPQLQWLDGTVSNDALGFASGAALVLMTVMTFTRAPSARLLALSGVVIGVALLSKETDYGLILVLVVCLVARWRRVVLHRPGLLVLATPALLAGWWFARNAATFGSPLPPLSRILPRGQSPLHLRTLGLARAWVSTSVVSLVGNFPTLDGVKGGTAAAWRTALNTLDVVVAIGLGGATVAGWASAPSWDGGRRGLAGALTAAIIVSFVLMVANSVFIDFQPQGRYLLVAAPAAAVLAVGGGVRVVAALPARLRGPLAALAILAVLALDATAFETMRALAARVS